MRTGFNWRNWSGAEGLLARISDLKLGGPRERFRSRPVVALAGTRSDAAVEGTSSNLRRRILALRERKVKTAFSFCQK